MAADAQLQLGCRACRPSAVHDFSHVCMLLAVNSCGCENGQCLGWENVDQMTKRRAVKPLL